MGLIEETIAKIKPHDARRKRKRRRLDAADDAALGAGRLMDLAEELGERRIEAAGDAKDDGGDGCGPRGDRGRGEPVSGGGKLQMVHN